MNGKAGQGITAFLLAEVVWPQRDMRAVDAVHQFAQYRKSAGPGDKMDALGKELDGKRGTY